MHDSMNRFETEEALITFVPEKRLTRGTPLPPAPKVELNPLLAHTLVLVDFVRTKICDVRFVWPLDRWQGGEFLCDISSGHYIFL